ncbi:unnamed protein product [Adineta ricciae]|nr:unnamed protein product [Adineta ricciae]
MLVTVTETVGYGSYPVARKRPTDPSPGTGSDPTTVSENMIRVKESIGRVLEADGRIRSQIPIAGNHGKVIDPAGSCRTALTWVVGNNPMIISNWGTTDTVDDTTTSITLPFYVEFYNYRTFTLTLSSNGVVCFGGCSTAYRNTNLPSSSFSNATIFALWDDLYLAHDTTSEGIYYSTTGGVPNRQFTIEYYASRSSKLYRFQVIFDENSLGIVTIRYFQADDGGVSATIGVQESSTGSFMQYAADKANAVPVDSASTISPTLTLIFNSKTNTFTKTP